jgi:hypothetical protein
MMGRFSALLIFTGIQTLLNPEYDNYSDHDIVSVWLPLADDNFLSLITRVGSALFLTHLQSVTKHFGQNS